MSLPNPNLPVTEARLQEFYQQIKSYLGLREMPSGDMDEIVSPKPVTAKGGHRYSTEEQIVGTWIDGRPIYEKTVLCSTPTTIPSGTYTSQTTAHGVSNIDLDARLKMFVTTGSFGNRAWGNDNVVTTCLDITFNATVITIGSNNSVFQNKQYYVTIQYCKTTD